MRRKLEEDVEFLITNFNDQDRSCHAERSEESLVRLRFFAALSMTGLAVTVKNHDEKRALCAMMFHENFLISLQCGFNI